MFWWFFSNVSDKCDIFKQEKKDDNLQYEFLKQEDNQTLLNKKNCYWVPPVSLDNISIGGISSIRIL